MPALVITALVSAARGSAVLIGLKHLTPPSVLEVVPSQIEDTWSTYLAMTSFLAKDT
jgi:hypothetical protein